MTLSPFEEVKSSAVSKWAMSAAAAKHLAEQQGYTFLTPEEKEAKAFVTNWLQMLPGTTASETPSRDSDYKNIIDDKMAMAKQLAIGEPDDGAVEFAEEAKKYKIDTPEGVESLRQRLIDLLAQGHPIKVPHDIWDEKMAAFFEDVKHEASISQLPWWQREAARQAAFLSEPFSERSKQFLAERLAPILKGLEIVNVPFREFGKTISVPRSATEAGKALDIMNEMAMRGEIPAFGTPERKEWDERRRRLEIEAERQKNEIYENYPLWGQMLAEAPLAAVPLAQGAKLLGLPSKIVNAIYRLETLGLGPIVDKFLGRLSNRFPQLFQKGHKISEAEIQAAAREWQTYLNNALNEQEAQRILSEVTHTSKPKLLHDEGGWYFRQPDDTKKYLAELVEEASKTAEEAKVAPKAIAKEAEVTKPAPKPVESVEPTATKVSQPAVESLSPAREAKISGIQKRTSSIINLIHDKEAQLKGLTYDTPQYKQAIADLQKLTKDYFTELLSPNKSRVNTIVNKTEPIIRAIHDKEAQLKGMAQNSPQYQQVRADIQKLTRQYIEAILTPGDAVILPGKATGKGGLTPEQAAAKIKEIDNVARTARKIKSGQPIDDVQPDIVKKAKAYSEYADIEVKSDKTSTTIGSISVKPAILPLLGVGGTALTTPFMTELPSRTLEQKWDDISLWTAIPAGIGLGALTLFAVIAGRGKSVPLVAGAKLPSTIKLVQLIKAAKPALREQKILRHEELSRRVARAAGIVEKASYEGKAEAYRRSAGALKGEQPKAIFQPPPEAKFTSEDFNEMVNYVDSLKDWRYFEKFNTIEALDKLMLGALPQRHELKLLERAFGSDLVNAVLSKRSLGSKAWEWIAELSALPRAVMASTDMSFPGRQGLLITLAHPKMAWGSFGKMFKAFYNDKNAAVLDDVIKTRPHQKSLRHYDVYESPLPGTASITLGEREEFYGSKIADRIPHIKASNRAFAMFSNDMASQMWNKTVEHVFDATDRQIGQLWEEGLGGAGRTVKEIAEIVGKSEDEVLRVIGQIDTELSGYAHLLNSLRGRGPLGPFEKFGPILSNIFFAPRLTISRMVIPAHLFSKSRVARMEAMRSLLSLAGEVGGTLALLDMLGIIDMDFDWRGTGALKVKAGNTQIDLWGGYAQLYKFFGQLVTGQKITSMGTVKEVSRAEISSRFMQSKLAPIPGLLVDIMRGESFTGEGIEATPKSVIDQIYNRLTPLFIQDMIDVLRADNPLALTFLAPIAWFGGGLTTIVSELQLARDKAAGQKWGVSWDEAREIYGQAALNELENNDAQIQKILREDEENYVKRLKGLTIVEEQWYYNTGQIEKKYQDEIMSAVQEYRRTAASGISDDGRTPGEVLREKIQAAATNRREAYDFLRGQPIYAEIVANINKPLDEKRKEKMNPKDIARYEYQRLMYAPDMYDVDGDYRIEELAKREAEFEKRFGKDMLEYAKNYTHTRWNEPDELKDYVRAKTILKEYWSLADLLMRYFEERYPGFTELYKRYNVESRFMTDEQRKSLRKMYPLIDDYNRKLEAIKVEWRRREAAKPSPNGEDYLVKYYGNRPIMLQTAR